MCTGVLQRKSVTLVAYRCDDGVFNVEGGCYAKCIGLSREKEPFLWDAIRFGTVVENVELDESSREFDFESDALTENTRAAYPTPGCRAPRVTPAASSCWRVTHSACCPRCRASLTLKPCT